MPQTIEILASEPTRSLIASLGWPRSVRFLSEPGKRFSHHRAFIVACLEQLAEAEQYSGMERWFANFRGRRVACPRLVFWGNCTGGGKSYTFDALQAMALFSRRATPIARTDPYLAPDEASLRRLVLANVHGAEKNLIASASCEDGFLSVWNCEPRLYRCPVDQIPALVGLSPESLRALRVSDSGSRIHWSEGDVDINLETIRALVDPAFRKRNEAKSRLEAARYGKAIRALREKLGIAQKGVAGLSDRQVRRLEEGRTMPHIDTLKKLAAAHGMSVDKYLDELAKLSRARIGGRAKASQ